MPILKPFDYGFALLVINLPSVLYKRERVMSKNCPVNMYMAAASKSENRAEIHQPGPQGPSQVLALGLFLLPLFTCPTHPRARNQLVGNVVPSW